MKEKERKDSREISGQNAESAAAIKAAEVRRSAFGVEENAGNQETGKDKEEVDAQPADDRGLNEESGQAVGGTCAGPIEAVIEQDGKNGTSAQDVELGHVLLEQRGVVGSGHAGSS